MKDKIKELLGMNIPATVVAQAVGCDDSYISQLLTEEDFATEVSKLKVEFTAANASRDRKYDTLEDKLIHKLEEKIDSPLLFTKPMELLKAIQILNGLKRRAAPASPDSGEGKGLVLSLELPENSAFAAKFVLNKTNQVVEIAGRSITTMSAKEVVKKLEKSGAAPRALPDPALDKKDFEEAENRIAGLVKLDTLDVPSLAEQL